MTDKPNSQVSCRGRKPRSRKRPKRNSVDPRSGLNNPLDGPFPRKYVVKLNYSDVYTLTEAAAGAGTNQVFRPFDVYDPDQTGVGHQPMYFDRLCSSIGPYMSFVVPRAEFQLRMSNVSAYPVLVTVIVAPYTTIPASRTIAAERPGVWKRLLAPNGTGGATVQHVVRCDNEKLAGVSPAAYESIFQGNYNTSAGGLVNNYPHYLQVAVWGIGGIGSVALQVDAIYTTKFMALGTEPQS